MLTAALVAVAIDRSIDPRLHQTEGAIAAGTVRHRVSRPRRKALANG